MPYLALPGAHNNASKKNSDLKIRGLSPYYKINKLRFRKGCEHTDKLLDQLWRFPKAPHDDYPDSASMHLHLPIIPSDIWKSKKEIKVENIGVDRYGQEISNKKSDALYV